jgi:Cof subfamily protein (haloacid dehalogenase superfamily)
MKSKAIIFDVDGTAVDSPNQKIPSERLKNAVRKIENGYFVCAATGRAWSFAKPVLQGMELQDPCITSAGTQIRDPKDGKVLWQCDIEPPDAEKVKSIAGKYPDLHFLYNDNDENDYLLHGGVSINDMDIDGPLYFFEFVFVPESVTSEILEAFSRIDGLAVTKVESQRPGGLYDIHITNKYATKEHAVDELLKLINVDKKNTIGIGDGHNDLHLFNAVHHKVAMGNAVDDLKEKADEVIGLVSEDGLAEYLERLGSK